jgi:hypothetical protein
MKTSMLIAVLAMLLTGCGTKFTHPSKGASDFATDNAASRNGLYERYPINNQTEISSYKDKKGNTEFITTTIDANEYARDRAYKDCIEGRGWKSERYFKFKSPE